MKTVIIAAAPITKEKFQPIYAEFPISDKTLLSCMGSHTVTDDVLSAACTLMGLDAKVCVTGMYYRLPDRENRPFELFIMDLRKRHSNARNNLQRQQEAVLRRRRQDLFHSVLKL